VSLPDNDSSIADSHRLLRPIPDRPRLLARRTDGGLRPSSAALELRDGETGCSVDVRERLRDPSSPLDALSGHPATWGLAECPAGAARADDRHRVVGDALRDNQAHALIVPTASSRARQKRNFGKLAESMTFLREPDIPAG
jgi:hypothetical protein